MILAALGLILWAAAMFVNAKAKANPAAQYDANDEYDVCPGKCTVDTIEDHKVIVDSFNCRVAVVKVMMHFVRGVIAASSLFSSME